MKRDAVVISSQHSQQPEGCTCSTEGQGINGIHQNSSCALLPGVIFESVINYVISDDSLKMFVIDNISKFCWSLHLLYV